MKTRMTIKKQQKYYIYSMNLLLWSQCVSIGSADSSDQDRMYIYKYANMSKTNPNNKIAIMSNTNLKTKVHIRR